MKTKFTYLFIVLFCFLGLDTRIFAQYQTKSLSWNTKAYESYTYNGPEGSMPYRLLRPRNYNSKVKYPMIIMLHGRGEGIGACANPDCNLMWGGKMHLDSINKYPSFVVFPRTHGGDWSDPQWNKVRGIMQYLAKTYSVDIDRVYIHGLSAGGQGVWRMALANPNAFAAISPMSGSGDQTRAGNVAFTPIWTVQGANDTSPRPGVSKAMMDALVKYGRRPIYTLNPTTKKQVWPSPTTTEPIYTLVPNVAHEAWPTLYNSPRWLKWVYSQSKRHIIVNGNHSIAVGESTTLGISPGFLAYEWSNGQKTNSIKVTSPGTYKVRYKRYAYIYSGPQVWSDWSDPVTITRKARLAEAQEVTPADATALKPKVTGFTIVNADAGTDVHTLRNGDVVDLSGIPAGYVTVKAHLDTVFPGTVRFRLDGVDVQETSPEYPYLYGDNEGHPLPGNLPEGKHALTAIPYTYNDEGFYNGDSLTIEFTVTYKKDQDSTGTGMAPDDEIQLYPNPLQDRLYFNFESPQKNVHIFILDKYGNLLNSADLSGQAELRNGDVDISRLGLDPGLYMIKIAREGRRERLFKVLKE